MRLTRPPPSPSRGRIDVSTSSEADKRQADASFQRDPLVHPCDAVAGVRCQLTRSTAYGTETIIAPEAAVPATVAACVIEEAAS